MSDDVDADLALLEARARRRWRRLQLPFGLLWGVFYAVMLHVFDASSGEPARSWRTVPFLALLSAAMYAGVRLWIGRKPGRLPVSLLLGLPPDARRRIRADLRHATPSTDDLTRRMELRVASRRARQSVRDAWLVAGAVVVLIAYVGWDDGGVAARVLLAAVLAAMIASVAVQTGKIVRARRYLTVATVDPR